MSSQITKKKELKEIQITEDGNTVHKCYVPMDWEVKQVLLGKMEK